MREQSKTEDPVTPEVDKEMGEVLDEGVGQIREAIFDAGIGEKSFILFLSDNGPAGLGSAAPLWGRKAQIGEGGHRVRAVAGWPGATAGSVSHATVMGADQRDTLAATAGAALPEGETLDGFNLFPYLNDAEISGYACKYRIGQRSGFKVAPDSAEG